MPSAKSFIIIFCTVARPAEGRKLAQRLLDKKLAACVNIVSGVESHYWWKGKKTSGREALLIIKARKSRWKKIEALLRKYHSYIVPEILAVPLAAGNAPYLAWIQSETR